MDKLKFDRDLLFISMLGLTLYLQYAWVPGFFHDGYLYAAFGKNAAEYGHWLVPHLSEATYSRFFHHTPFIFILEGLFFKVFGSSFLTARIFGASWALLTGLFLFKFLKRLGTEYWAKFSLILFWIIPPLMKKSRFPNLDLPLMLFFLLSLTYYFKAFSEKKRRDWIISGFFFGLALLTKGPVGLFIPLIIFVHTLLKKRWEQLLRPLPWISLALGFSLFGLWPLALWFNGEIEIFLKWFDFTFLETITYARGEGSPFYTYFVFLLKQTSLWIILAGWSIFQIYFKHDKKYKEVIDFSLISFLVILLPFSIAKFKYSNYLIPLYPFLTIVAGYSIHFMGKMKDRFFIFINSLGVVVPLVLLIFPLTNKIKRDPQIFEIRSELKSKNIEIKTWVNFRETYPFWALANLNGWMDYSNTYNLFKEEDLSSDRFKNKTLFLVKNEDQNYFQQSKKYKKLMQIENRINVYMTTND